MSSIAHFPPTTSNPDMSTVPMYVKGKNQGLPPDDVKVIAREIFKAVGGSDPTAPAPPENGDEEAVKALLAAGYKDLKEKADTGSTALIYNDATYNGLDSCHRKNHIVVTELIGRGVKEITTLILNLCS
jgi:hypothetical protein